MQGYLINEIFDGICCPKIVYLNINRAVEEAEKLQAIHNTLAKANASNHNIEYKILNIKIEE